MTQLSSTLGKCAKDLAGFAVMFFIIFLAFTQLGYLLFGTQVKDFSDFKNSLYASFGISNIKSLIAANDLKGPNLVYFSHRMVHKVKAICYNCSRLLQVLFIISMETCCIELT